MDDEIAYRHFSGLKLYKARIALGLSRERLAERLDCSTMTIFNWERGTSTPNADRLERLSCALHQPIDYFYAKVKPDAPR